MVLFVSAKITEFGIYLVLLRKMEYISIKAGPKYRNQIGPKPHIR